MLHCDEEGKNDQSSHLSLSFFSSPKNEREREKKSKREEEIIN